MLTASLKHEKRATYSRLAASNQVVESRVVNMSSATFVKSGQVVRNFGNQVRGSALNHRPLQHAFVGLGLNAIGTCESAGHAYEKHVEVERQVGLLKVERIEALRVHLIPKLLQRPSGQLEVRECVLDALKEYGCLVLHRCTCLRRVQNASR